MKISIIPPAEPHVILLVPTDWLRIGQPPRGAADTQLECNYMDHGSKKKTMQINLSSISCSKKVKDVVLFIFRMRIKKTDNLLHTIKAVKP